MKRFTALAALFVLAGTTAAFAQEAQKASGAAATTSGINTVYSVAKGYLLATAEQIPADKYAFQATKEVRTIAQLIGHVADAQKMFCSIAAGNAAPPEDAGSEKLTDKAALVAALKDSFAYCDGVVAKLTDADLTRQVKLFGMDINVAGVLAMNAAHDFEHYGNLVTYMRMNGMVPPSSQRQGR